jgi:hypothetical protein
LGIKTNSPLNYLGCAEMVLLIWLPKNEMPFKLVIPLLKDGKIRLDILDNTFVVGQRILVASIKKEKERLALLIDALDLKAESILLNAAEREAKKEADECFDT